MTNQSWPPDDVSRDKPSVARMYDYLLGGPRNFAVDRAAAEEMIALNPDFLLWQTLEGIERKRG